MYSSLPTSRIEMNMNKLLFALGTALDMADPRIKGHSARVAYIAVRIGALLGFGDSEIRELAGGAMLHDIGISSAESRVEMAGLDMDDERVQYHCLRGASLVSQAEVFRRFAGIIRCHHRRWDASRDEPASAAEWETQARDMSQIVCVADRVEIMLRRAGTDFAARRHEVIEQVKAWSGTYLAPEYVDAFLRLARSEAFWLDLAGPIAFEHLEDWIGDTRMLVRVSDLQDIAEVFAAVIDAKSTFTAHHPRSVAAASRFLASRAGFSDTEATMLEVAGFLHDLGKLAMPDEILEKPSGLTPAEFGTIKAHPYYTYELLHRVEGFERIAEWAAFHHEKMDGTGYPFGLSAGELSLPARIIAIADVYTAVREPRPYRQAVPMEKSLELVRRAVAGGHLDGEVADLLIRHAEELEEAPGFLKENRGGLGTSFVG